MIPKNQGVSRGGEDVDGLTGSADEFRQMHTDLVHDERELEIFEQLLAIVGSRPEGFDGGGGHCLR